MPTPSIFLAHASADALFARRLGTHLAALGARVRVEDGEMRDGDSLLTRIGAVDGDLTHLAVVLSPEASLSAWVREELRVVRGPIEPLLVYYRRCDLPDFLQGEEYVDFTRAFGYDEVLFSLARDLGLHGGTFEEMCALLTDRHTNLPSRPRRWFCVECGAGPMPSFNDYICVECRALRPFVGGSATMAACPRCRQWNLLVARYCEWCGLNVRAGHG